MVTRALTLAEIAALPAVTDLVTAGRALGIGRSKSFGQASTPPGKPHQATRPGRTPRGKAAPAGRTTGRGTR